MESACHTYPDDNSLLFPIKFFPQTIWVSLLFFALLIPNKVVAEQLHKEQSYRPEISFTLGHPSRITQMIPLDKGRKLLSSGEEGTIILWDVKNKKSLERYDSNPSFDKKITVSSDETRALFQAGPHEVFLWDLKNWGLLSKLSGPYNLATCLAFSPDGQLAAIGDDRNNVLIFDLATNSILSKFNFSAKEVRFSPDGNRLLTVSSNGSFRYAFWDIQTGALLKTSGKTATPVELVSISPKGDRIFFLSGKNLFLFNPYTGKILLSLQSPYEIPQKVGFSQDGRLLYHSGRKNTSITFWNADSGEQTHVIPDHSLNLSGYYFSPDQNLWLTGSHRGEIHNWNIDTGKVTWKLAGSGADIRSLSVSPKEGLAAAQSNRGQVFFWDLGNGKLKQILDQKRMLERMPSLSRYYYFYDSILSSNGQFFASMQNEDIIIIWDHKKKKMVKRWSIPEGEVYDIAITEDGKYLITGGKKSLILWDVPTGKIIKSFDASIFPVRCLGISPDGSQFTVGSDTGDVTTLDIPSGKLVNKLTLPRRYIISEIKYSPDSTHFAVLEWFGNLHFFNAKTYKPVHWLDLIKEQAIAISWTDDNHQGIYSTLDGKVRSWNLKSSQKKKTFSLPGRIQQFTYLKDKSLILGYDIFGTIRIWDALTGRGIANLAAFTNGEWAAWTPEGYYTTSPGGEAFLKAKLNGKWVEMKSLRDQWRKPQELEHLLQRN